MPTAEEIAAQKAGFVQVRKSPANELRKMRVQEVGMVPFGANARVFPVVKADGESSMKIKMSPQALKTALGALQELSEKVASTTAIAAGAELDEAAGPPVELGKLFKALGESSLGLAKQYGGMDEEEEKKKAAELEAAKAGKPFAGAAPPFGKKKPGDHGDDEEEAAKAIEFGVAVVQKAGRKMAKARLDQVKAAHVALGKVLAEVDDAPDSSESGPGLKKTLAAIVAKLDALSPPAASVRKSDDAPLDAKAVQAMIEKSAAETTNSINAALTAMNGGKRTTIAAPSGNAAGAGRSEARPPRVPDNLADYAGDAYKHLD